MIINYDLIIDKNTILAIVFYAATGVSVGACLLVLVLLCRRSFLLTTGRGVFFR